MINVAVDGPAGVGKSSVSKEVAKRLGFVYVDTGALYRTVALYMIENNITLQDITASLKDIKIQPKSINGKEIIFLNGEVVGDKIRTEEVSALTSKIAGLEEVRQYLLNLQRQSAKNDNVVMDGRDIGTVVLKEANVKIYIEAKAAVRAQRRYKQLQNAGVQCNYEEILKAIEQRDFADKTREIAPLKKAEDATVVDTTNMSFKESINRILEIVKDKTQIAAKG